MSNRVKAFIAIIVFYGAQLALNHSTNPAIERFMTQCWFSKHWYSPFLLSTMLFSFLMFFWGRHHHKRSTPSKVG